MCDTSYGASALCSPHTTAETDSRVLSLVIDPLFARFRVEHGAPRRFSPVMSMPEKKRSPFALILIEWLCFLETRRVMMRFHLSGDKCTLCPLKAGG